MMSAYTKGLKRASLYYLSGILLGLSLHQVIGWDNFSILPRSFLVIVFMLMVSLPWAFLNLTNLFCSEKRPQNLGELVIHGLVFTIAAGFIIFLRLKF